MVSRVNIVFGSYRIFSIRSSERLFFQQLTLRPERLLETKRLIETERLYFQPGFQYKSGQ